jgi:hypothetical protein
MMWKFLPVLVVLLAAFAQVEARQEMSQQQRAVEAIERLGGKVEYDDVTQAVIKVDLHNTKVSDNELKNLRAFGELRWLDLRITGIGDEGVAHLKKLKRLTFLNLFRTNLSDKGLAELRICLISKRF